MNVRHADLGSTAGHQALHRRGVADIERLAMRVDADLRLATCGLTHGRRADVCFHRRSGRRRIELQRRSGTDKRSLPPNLYHRLLQRPTRAQGLVHFGQGKWYPGEQLPRWSLNCFWRADGEPIWHGESLIADESRPGMRQRLQPRLSSGVAERLGLDAQHVFPAYEDALYFLWRERRLPANVDPFDSRLEDTLERERLVRVFSQGLKQVVGYALPMARDTPRHAGVAALGSYAASAVI